MSAADYKIEVNARYDESKVIQATSIILLPPFWTNLSMINGTELL